MNINPQRNYKNPKLYDLSIASSLNKDDVYRKTIFLLHSIYPIVVKVLSFSFSNKVSLGDNELNAIYKNLNNHLKKLFSIETIAYLSSFAPQLPDDLTEETIAEESSNWEGWLKPDVLLFKNILEKEAFALKNDDLAVPEEISLLIQRAEELISTPREMDHKVINDLLTAHDNKSKNGFLEIFPNGEFVYTHPNGKKTAASAKTSTNQYKLLKKLASEPTRVFLFAELTEVLNITEDGSDSPPERRIRDAIQAIRKKLNVKEGEVFKADGGFRLICGVKLSP